MKVDGVTPSMLLNCEEYSILKVRFMAHCKENGINVSNPKILKRHARKWLERNNYRWLKAA